MLLPFHSYPPPVPPTPISTYPSPPPSNYPFMSTLETSATTMSPILYDKSNTTYLDRYKENTTIASRLDKMHLYILNDALNSRYPNDKEVTEAMAAFVHTEKTIMPHMTELPSQGVLRDVVLCIGDGSTPRSAALFALHFPSWECYSIDPQLREVGRSFLFSRIGLHPHTRPRKKSRETGHGCCAKGTSKSMERNPQSPHCG